jgi:phosphinothricin acetyltransferase
MVGQGIELLARAHLAACEVANGLHEGPLFIGEGEKTGRLANSAEDGARQNARVAVLPISDLVRIRHADPARDAAACAAIYAPYVTDTVISLEEVAPDAHEMAARMEATARTHPWLVAELDGVVAGYAYASRHRERGAYRWAADVTVYVGPYHHRRGVGRALYETLLGLLADQGFRTACAGITLPNPASVGLHEACGFRPVGVYRAIGWKLGAWRDVGWWQCDLAGPSGGPPSPLRGPAWSETEDGPEALRRAR